MGAVFNRDFLGNRGRRPLPPTINFYLIDLEFYVFSYQNSEVLDFGLRSLRAVGLRYEPEADP